jgi:hypothetical protein
VIGEIIPSFADQGSGYLLDWELMFQLEAKCSVARSWLLELLPFCLSAATALARCFSKPSFLVSLPTNKGKQIFGGQFWQK